MTLRLLTLSLGLALLTTVTMGHANELVIYPSAEEIQPLQPGDDVPDFNVTSVEGESVAFGAGERDKPAMIVTFRGGWCPFCNVQLKELRTVVPELNEAGMEVFFFSGDSAEVLYTGLKDSEVQDIAAAQDYVIYSDAEAEAASALGIAFAVPEKRRGMMIDRFGSTNSTGKHGVLPVPAVFIVDTSGKVAFSYTNPDYKVRLSTDEVRKAALEALAE